MSADRNYISLSDIEDALGHIASDDREVWVRIGKALHDEFGETAFSAWDNWSQSSPSYTQRDAKAVWKSIGRMSSGGKPVTIATVIYEAKQGGWRPKKSEPPPADVIARHKQEREERQAELTRLEAERSEAAAATALEIWTAATEASDDHPYLKNKNVPALGLRHADSVSLKFIDEDTGEIKPYTVKNALIVPAWQSAKKLSSVQVISADGKKRFLLDGRMSGAYAKIGDISKAATKIIICEGWATGASIHLATGLPVIIAFNAGNLKAVCDKMHAALPAAEIIVAADNDQFTRRRDGQPWNPGLEAAQTTDRRIVLTEFASLEGEPTDFNDLHIREGLDAVKRAFETPVPAVVTDAPPAITPDRRAIDIFSPLPDVNDRMKPLSTIENVEEICDRLGVVVRYNVIAKEEEILIPNSAFSIDNKANASFAWLTSWCARFRMPTANLGDFITYLSDKNLHNPVTEWITSKPWDGNSRLQSLYDTIKAKGEDQELKEILIMRWMISAVAAAFLPDGIAAKGVLVLQGGQNAGKTTWFKSLVPESLGVVKDGMMLRPDDKDSVKQVCSFWLVELGELDATFRKADIAALKSFITNKSDVLRRAYARKESHFARRTVFFGSVNPQQFLHDSTGNIRYWTIECESINFKHGLDMQQIWAEVYESYYRPWEQAGGRDFAPWYLNYAEVEALNHSNEEFTVTDPVEDRLSSKLAWDSPKSTWKFMTTTEALQSVGMDKPTIGDTTKAGHFIRKMNGGVAKRSGSARLVLVPDRIDRYN